MQKTSKTASIGIIAIALVVWFSVILQFTISIDLFLHQGRTVGGAIVHLLSFFTILSNILVGCCLLAMQLKPTSAFQRFFATNSVITGIALYITIVGLVYNIVLRSLWHPLGLFKLADEFLHSFNPLAFVAIWFVLVPKYKLKLSQALTWLVFPVLYLVYILARGAVYNLYPYPFLNVDNLGYQQVLINSFFMMIAFLIFDTIFFLLNNRLADKRQ